MTKAEVVAMFKKEILPRIRDTYEADGIPDYPARSEAWNNYTDALHKDGYITARQYDTWTAPDFVDRRKY